MVKYLTIPVKHKYTEQQFLVLSWFVSPLLSGVVSIMFYIIIDHAVLRRSRPLRCGLIFLPILYFVCVAVNVFAIVYDGSACKFIFYWKFFFSSNLQQIFNKVL